MPTFLLSKSERDTRNEAVVGLNIFICISVFLFEDVNISWMSLALLAAAAAAAAAVSLIETGAASLEREKEPPKK